MKIVAKSMKGHEFLYVTKSAHKVPNASANIICKALNDAKSQLKDNEVWFVHDVSEYDDAYNYAMWQAFSRRNGAIRRTTSYGGWM